MVTKVKDHPYFFVIITRLLKYNLKCLVNKQPKTEDKKKYFVIVFYTCLNIKRALLKLMRVKN